MATGHFGLSDAQTYQRCVCEFVLNTSLLFPRESKISSSEHMRIGGSEQVAWLQLCEPTEKDKGKYTFELFDGKTAHKRSIDLSGQGNNI